MQSIAQSMKNQKLNRPVNRRAFLQGAIGISGLAVLGAGTMTSCSTADVKENKELGGTLNFFGFDGQDAPDIAKPFLVEHGIKMQSSYQSALDEGLTRFNTGGRGSMDILSANKDFQAAVLDAGTELFQPIDLDAIPNASGLFPAFHDAPWLTRNGDTFGIPLVWGDTPCAYLPSKWDGVPDKYTDFADPQYAGELAVLDDPFGIIWMFASSLGFPEPHRLTADELDATIDALMEVKPNIVTFSASYGDMADVLVRGDVSMAIGAWAYLKTVAAEKGVELETAGTGVDPVGYWSDAYAIAVDAPNIENAHAFINFMMSPEANAAIATELGSGCTVEDAVALMPDDMQDAYPYDDVRESAGGVLASQTMMPPEEDDGDIVGASAWAEAWQQFKLG